jgi:hypothetical protein
MGGRELIGLEAVVPHQQPVGEPFVEPAAPIRKRRLAGLHHESVDIVQQGGSETLAATHDLAQ